jgi:hypothetical protein
MHLNVSASISVYAQAGLSLSGLLLRRAAAALHLLEEDGSADLVLLASELMRVAQQTMRLRYAFNEHVTRFCSPEIMP